MPEQNSDILTQDAPGNLDDAQEAPEYNLGVSADKVTVVLDCPDPLADLDTWVPQILADFARLEIPVFPDAEQLTKILRNIAAPDCHLRGAPIVMGQDATASQDGKLVWSREFFSPGWFVDPVSGNIDFWDKLENRSVQEGEFLVKLHHPLEGDPGLSVYGHEIPVTKPAKVTLRCGKGVRTEEAEDGVLYFAEFDGRVRFADGNISVDELFVIKGNVSLATGNIRHTGAVQIQGDVDTGATIEAGGDIMIKGMVDPCNIRCGGTLTVAGGLVGSDDHLVEVAGDFNVRYVNEANIIVGGDVTVSNEISHSFIKARGKILIPKGRIAGGCVQAYKGIRVAEAGASGSTDTTLIAGVDYTIEDQVQACAAQIRSLEKDLEITQTTLGNLPARQGGQDSDEQKIREGLAIKATQLGRAIADEQAVIKKITQESKKDAVLEVVMTQEVWSGTRIHLGEFKTLVKSSIQKPRIAQLRQTRVRVLPLGEGNMPDD